MRVSKHFLRREFNCKDGTAVPDDYICNVITLASQLDIIREEVGEAIYISSGYRTIKHNKKCKGAKNSKHLTAEAADLKTLNTTPDQLYFCIIYLIKAGKIKDGGVGLYDNFVHYDIGKPRRWFQSKDLFTKIKNKSK